MSDKIEEKPPATPTTPAPKPADAKPTPAPRATKIVEETGRYVCKSQIAFTNEKGERANAKKGDVVGIAAEDAKYLKRVGVIIEETREE